MADGLWRMAIKREVVFDSNERHLTILTHLTTLTPNNSLSDRRSNRTWYSSLRGLAGFCTSDKIPVTGCRQGRESHRRGAAGHWASQEAERAGPGRER